MNTALLFLLAVGVLGAFDTIYYHEWNLRLPEASFAGRELKLHAARDFVYAILFGSLGWVTWQGAWTWVLAAPLLTEIAITLSDFIQEDRTRKLPAGERVTHAILGIVYGIFLALLYPQLVQWSRLPAGFERAEHGVIAWVVSAFAAGVLLSGLRDWRASRGLRSPA